MTLLKMDGAGPGDDCVDLAEEQFVEALRAVAAITEKIRRQELDVLPDVPKAAANVSIATRQLLAEKHRVYEQQKRKSGIVHDFAIDFDEARAEIGRRLACLRAAADR